MRPIYTEASPVRTTLATEKRQLSNSTLALISHQLNSSNGTFVRKAGESVRLVCGEPTLVLAVQEEMADSELVWHFNSLPLVMDPSRMLFYKDNLDLTGLTTSDSGVYTCGLAWNLGEDLIDSTLTVAASTLQVTTESTTRFVHHGSSLPLPCHSSLLGRLFPTARRYWLHNNTRVTSPRPLPADSRDLDLVEGAEYKMAGEWACHVEEKKTGRVWGTAWHRVAVLSPPSLMERSYRVMLDHPLVSLTLAGLVAGMVLVAFICACVRLTRDEDRKEKKIELEKEGWEKLFDDNNWGGGADIDDVENEALVMGVDGGNEFYRTTRSTTEEDLTTSEDRDVSVYQGRDGYHMSEDDESAPLISGNRNM